MALFALGLLAVAALLNVSSAFLGLYSLISGKDHWPRALRFLRKRVPATENDHRTQGAALLLNGAGVMLIVMGGSMNVQSMLGRISGEPVNTIQFGLTLAALSVAMGCIIGAYVIRLRVQYVSGPEVGTVRG
jgi:hypothetical protein